MLELFNNPGYFAVGAAAVSAPVIIHLINRMRFRRLRWAAMEFLLKAQKRNRRRLIIEQLILLALRCLLIMLTALLVLRFVGFSLAGYSGQDALHVIVLDDTLSMTDQWKEGGQDRNSFKVAKEDIIVNNILKKIAQSTTNERLAIIPLSKVAGDPEFRPTVYSKLAEHATEGKVAEELDNTHPTKLHTDLAVGLDAASNLVAEHPDKRPVIHIVSDFRSTDWSGDEAEKLKKILGKLKTQKASLQLWDCAHPVRLLDQGGIPQSHDNVAIVDFKANSRLVGKGMPVTFSVTVANHSANDKKVNVVIYRYQNEVDNVTGKEMIDAKTGKEILKVAEQGDLNFVPQMPFSVPAHGQATATFKYTPQKIKENAEFYSEKFAVHLETPEHGTLDDDGLPGDNIRYANVQIRDKIPFLIIDGSGSSPYEREGTTYIETALKSISNSYDFFYGELVQNKPDPTMALESPKLMQYAAIYLINVEKLTGKNAKGEVDDLRLKNLENYVREGGSVFFFLGPKVSGDYYTKELYRKGEGIFPAPLKDEPTEGNVLDVADPVSGKGVVIGSQLLLRDDKVALKDLPIFGNMIKSDEQKELLRYIMIQKYFSVPRNQWQQPKGQIHELATLPNKQSAINIGLDAPVSKVLNALDALLEANPDYKTKFGPGLKKYRDAIQSVITEAKAYQIGWGLYNLLTEDDPAKSDTPKKFWALNDPKVAALNKEIKDIAEQALYGDPLIVTRQFGKGRVVAVMTTVGESDSNPVKWNDWPSKIGASLWPLFQKYSLEYLFDQSAESSFMVGHTDAFAISPKKYQQKDSTKHFKMFRTFYQGKVNQQVKPTEIREPGTLKDGVLHFTFKQNPEDGFYLNQLFADEDLKTPLETWEHVFNVDTKTESKLQRISQEEAKDNVLYKDYGDVKISGFTNVDRPELINKQSDLSDSPWFYLLFLIVLISEQALAVHLSYHLRGAENQLPAQAATSSLRAA